MDVHWLHERFGESCYKLIYEETRAMRADILTKGFVDMEQWRHALMLINHVDPKTFGDSTPKRKQSKSETLTHPKRGVSPKASMRWLLQPKARTTWRCQSLVTCFPSPRRAGGGFTGWCPRLRGQKAGGSMTRRQVPLVQGVILQGRQ